MDCIIDRIQSLYAATEVYTPGQPSRPQPYPKETIPIDSHIPTKKNGNVVTYMPHIIIIFILLLIADRSIIFSCFHLTVP